MTQPNPPARVAVRALSARPSCYHDRARPVALRSEEVRAEFITRTYLHLFGAIVAFTILEAFYFATGLALPIAAALQLFASVALMFWYVLRLYLARRR